MSDNVFFALLGTILGVATFAVLAVAASLVLGTVLDSVRLNAQLNQPDATYALAVPRLPEPIVR